MRNLFILLSSAIIILCQSSFSLAAEKTVALAKKTSPIEGVWLTKDGDSHVQIVRCEESLCNEILWLKQPKDKYGKPMTDKLNKNKKLRGRPVIGISILLGMRRVNDNFWRGRLYKPRHGKTYAGHVRLINDSKLEIKGCHEFLPICKTQFWKKISSIEGYKTN